MNRIFNNRNSASRGPISSQVHKGRTAVEEVPKTGPHFYLVPRYQCLSSLVASASRGGQGMVSTRMAGRMQSVNEQDWTTSFSCPESPLAGNACSYQHCEVNYVYAISKGTWSCTTMPRKRKSAAANAPALPTPVLHHDYSVQKMKSMSGYA